jgi:hypothetical protein
VQCADSNFKEHGLTIIQKKALVENKCFSNGFCLCLYFLNLRDAKPSKPKANTAKVEGSGTSETTTRIAVRANSVPLSLSLATSANVYSPAAFGSKEPVGLGAVIKGEFTLKKLNRRF